MSWNNILTGGLVVWLNNLGNTIPWINIYGANIDWRNGGSLSWQQIATVQQPYWGTLILKWKNTNSTVLGWSNSSSIQLKWRSNQFISQPFNEPNAFWTTVAT